MRVNTLFVIISSLWLFSVCAQAQTQPLTSSSGAKSTEPPDLLFLERADSLNFNEAINPDAQILYGDVVFRHDSSYMYCDSAYFYETTNSMEAFSNVRMEQGDTLFVYGQYLFYDGNTRMGYLRENVRMENNQVTLFTDSLNYDRQADIGYYFDGGLIVDEENELSSYYGQYSPTTKLAIFNDSVLLNNPDFILHSDTLHYYTDSKVAIILGPSVIETDSGTIYTSRGWYDTENQTSLLLDRSRVETKDKILIGDSILYDQGAGFGEVFGNMFLQDTTNHMILEGEYGYYDEQIEFALATDSARFLEYGQGDTLYLHADTLQMITLEEDFREIKAYYGVRFYRTDLQGVCDSMYFTSRDSVLYMFDDPILWNESYQMNGDTILVHFNDSTIDHAHVKQFAFAIQEVDSVCFNQLKGSDLKAFFIDGAISQIDVAGNAESIYYPIEKDGSMVGLNETKSGFLSMWFTEGKYERLSLFASPSGTITPIPQVLEEQRKLKDFNWFQYIRPLDKDDIFFLRRRNVESTPRRSNKFVH